MPITLPRNVKIYGPYKRPDGRKHVIEILHDEAGVIVKRTTISYPKFLLEGMLMRELPAGFTVDHADRDFTNDAPINLRALPLPDHAAEDAIRVEVDLVNCIYCNEQFKPSQQQINKRSKSKAGPFCSRSCVGSYFKDPAFKNIDRSRGETPHRYYRNAKNLS